MSTSPDNIWITGGGPPAYSLLLQWNGQQWIDHSVPVPPGYPPYLATDGLSMTGPDNAWMLYNNLLEHYDGKVWSVVYIFNGTALPLGVWADPKGNAWVGDGDGNIDEWTPSGVVIQSLSLGTFTGTIWGTGDDDVFVTTIGAIFHYDGNAFTKIYSGKTCGWYEGVKNDVWISGDTILHWDGAAMTDTGIDANFTSTARFDGAGYEGSNDVWFTEFGDPSGALANVFHWDGTQLTTSPIDPASTVTPLGDTRCSGYADGQYIGGKWFIVCDGGGVATLGSNFDLEPVIDPRPGYSMWGTSEDDLYVVTGHELQHWDGSAWSRNGESPAFIIQGLAGTGTGGTSELFGLHDLLSGSDEVDTAYFDLFDGSAWTSFPVTQYVLGDPIQNITSTYPLGPNEAMIVGGHGNAFWFANGTLTPIATGTTADLLDVWGPDSDHLWISGGSGTLLEWERTNPDAFVVDTTFPGAAQDLDFVAGVGDTLWLASRNADDVWRRGSDGTWQDIDARVAATSIVTQGSDGLLISATDSGEVARWNGHTFDIEYYPSWFGLQHLLALPDGTTYLSGQRGTVVNNSRSASGNRRSGDRYSAH
nr:hypothetical protein [Kofleriaceae bacterium]